jgi:hypothetical protein
MENDRATVILSASKRLVNHEFGGVSMHYANVR